MGKGTPSQRGGKIVHVICRRCGKHSYHRQKKRLRLVRVRRTPRGCAATTGRSSSGSAPVAPTGRGDETNGSPSIAKRSGRSAARRIPTRGARTIGPTASRAVGGSRTGPRREVVPSSSRVIPSARQSRPGPLAFPRPGPREPAPGAGPPAPVGSRRSRSGPGGSGRRRASPGPANIDRFRVGRTSEGVVRGVPTDVRLGLDDRSDRGAPPDAAGPSGSRAGRARPRPSDDRRTTGAAGGPSRGCALAHARRAGLEDVAAVAEGQPVDGDGRLADDDPAWRNRRWLLPP